MDTCDRLLILVDRKPENKALSYDSNGILSQEEIDKVVSEILKE